MFNRTAEQEKELESYRTQKFRRFQNQSGAYFGNNDEQDGKLLTEEVESEDLGWTQGCERIAAALGLPNMDAFPPIPREELTKLSLSASENDTQTDAAKRNLNAIDASELTMPQVPDRKDIERFLLRAKKAALRSEYLGEAPAA
ncbi:hypothetical protein MBRA1_001572 [Malassezia brasiliensis]|uniref:Uncharacterized protein n=1 Tax=Malassezia brasiliensis TaxID=1821822 RepID=A0AAF0INB9_9BASI|nr:hypothetical protein MBRA1_001572 [Malassezia brasiliensis]